MFLRSSLITTKVTVLHILFWLSLAGSSFAFAEEVHLQGSVVDYLTRQSLDQVSVAVIKDDELIQQQVIDAGEKFSLKFDYIEGNEYSLLVKQKEYEDEIILLSRALSGNSVPEQMKVSLGGGHEGFLFTGNITDRESGEAIPNAKLKLINKMTGEITETASDYLGNYTLRITPGYEYEMQTSNGDFLKRSAHINYCKETLSELEKYCFKGFLNLSLDAKGGVSAATTLMDRIEIGKKFIVDNIYYNYNEATLREDGLPNLDKVWHILTDNPQLIIELGSHADSRGSDGYNLKLSQRRAESAVNYVIEKGIAEKRISAKGYGEQALLNHCSNDVQCTEAEHEDNRRTEFTIIAIDEHAIVQ